MKPVLKDANAKTKLSKLHDNEYFYLSTRKGAALYKVNTKQKGKVIFTSENSGITYTRPGKTACWQL